MFAAEPTTESPLFELDNVVVTPHLGASTVEAQDKAGQTIAEQVVLALRGEFVPFAVNVAATEANATVQPFLPLAERLGAAVHRARRRRRRHARGRATRARSPTTTAGCSRSACSRACSRRSSTSRCRFVNAPQLAEERGLDVRETTSSSARDYVNLVDAARQVGDRRGPRRRHARPASRREPRIVGIDDHSVDVPPSSHMLVVRNADVPGMIGKVGTILGDAGVNIDDMDVGKSPTGEAALMVLDHVDARRAAAVVDELRAEPASSTPGPSSSTDLDRLRAQLQHSR